jgi:hypothetical protein
MTDENKQKLKSIAEKLVASAHSKGHNYLSTWYDAAIFGDEHSTKPAFDCSACGSTFVILDLDGTTMVSPGFGDCHEVQMGCWPRL